MSYRPRMRYRRNSDATYRQLERLAETGDENAFLQLIVETGRQKIIPSKEILEKIRSLFIEDYDLTRERDRETGSRGIATFIPIIIWNLPHLNLLGRVQEIARYDRTIPRDVLTVAGWLYDRKSHDPDPDSSRFLQIDLRIPFRIDMVDVSSDVYNSGIFSSVSALESWHDLTRLVDRGVDPRIYSRTRPTPHQAEEYAEFQLQNLLGTGSCYPLKALHGPKVDDSSFTIFAETPVGRKKIGSVSYRVEDGEFLAAQFKFRFVDWNKAGIKPRDEEDW